MKLKELTNIKIIEKQDRNLSNYFIIFNQNGTNESYFCWEKTIKTGWTDFANNWDQIQRIELEFEETDKGNKVINILSHDQSLDLFI